MKSGALQLRRCCRRTSRLLLRRSRLRTARMAATGSAPSTASSRRKQIQGGARALAHHAPAALRGLSRCRCRCLLLGACSVTRPAAALLCVLPVSHVTTTPPQAPSPIRTRIVPLSQLRIRYSHELAFQVTLARSPTASFTAVQSTGTGRRPANRACGFSALQALRTSMAALGMSPRSLGARRSGSLSR